MESNDNKEIKTSHFIYSLIVIFILVFTMIFVNMYLIKTNESFRTLFTFDLLTMSCIGFLVGIIQPFLPSGRTNWVLWLATGVALAAAIVLQFVMA